jgi:hypothetical protein
MVRFEWIGMGTYRVFLEPGSSVAGLYVSPLNVEDGTIRVLQNNHGLVIDRRRFFGWFGCSAQVDPIAVLVEGDRLTGEMMKATWVDGKVSGPAFEHPDGLELGIIAVTEDIELSGFTQNGAVRDTWSARLTLLPE